MSVIGLARRANSFQWHHVEERTSPPKGWHDYFEEISNVEFAHPATPFASLVFDSVQKITVSEIEAALRKMKSGPDDLPADCGSHP
ncbi:unnamed protein product [Heligmosomoides polygyrus]|uniref:Uncharacterized protein n=1 Tax=Heligmosomoides polygyrus TaxID=6339 RepID=A0A183F4S6_HELPZ|nr:unnamed protein product [Heligmosomoides polygyrus]